MHPLLSRTWIFGLSLVLVACPPTNPPLVGLGSLNITVTAPSGVATALTVAGPNGFMRQISANQTLTDLAVGQYSISAKSSSLRSGQSFVATAYDGLVVGSPATITANQTSNVSVSYAIRGGSGQLWVSDGDKAGSKLLAFAPARLTGGTGETADTPSPNTSIAEAKLRSATDMALASDGSLYVSSGFEETSRVLAYPPSALASSSGVAKQSWSTPKAVAIAIDSQNNLWAGLTNNTLLRFSPADLQNSTPTPSLTIDNQSSVTFSFIRKMAFDSAGNLWASRDGRAVLTMYSKDQLNASGESKNDPARIITLKDWQDGSISGLSFDASGNLWLTAAKPNDPPPNGAALKINANDLASSGEKTASISIAGFNSARNLSFDENGDLWVLAGSDNLLLRFAKAQLTQSGSPKAAQRFQIGTDFATSDLEFNPNVGK
jgi:hypothetical protein